ncbi:MAG: two-component system histidine kinase PnpS [Armatimonadota bacterium]
MPKRRLLWQLYPSYLFITVITLLAATLYTTWFLRNFYLQKTAEDLEARARIAESIFAPELAGGNSAAIDRLCKTLGKQSATRITIIHASGRVLGDTDENPTVMENHADRPEVQAALQGHAGRNERFSQTLRRMMMYVAVPVETPAGIIGIVRMSLPVSSIDHALRTVGFHVILGSLLAAVMAAIVSWVVSRRISRPLEDIRTGARRFAQGDLSNTLVVPETEEIGELADSLNEMAAHLDKRIRETLRQRNEQEAVLTSMMEGVLAVDNDERVIWMNGTAAHLLGIIDDARERPLHEVVRNTDLQRFIARVMAERQPIEGEVVLYDTAEHFMQVHGTILQDEREDGIGVLVVMNDMTHLRRLENVRREFVANVSHELRTPITSIKGFVETLLDGAMFDQQDARRFLEIIAKHAERLNAIIEDLLALSRIEQEAERAEILLQPAPIKPVLRSAMQACEMKALAREITMTLTCPDDLRAKINAPLLEQAVINLIDNAIKYSESGDAVEVSAEGNDGVVSISVLDHGCGIENEHLPRVFERFYRVDKGRSRKLGGTGLGLAIVKHITQAHGGRITVDSTPGLGSTFTIHLTD